MKIGMCACGSMNCQYCGGISPWNDPHWNGPHYRETVQYYPVTILNSELMARISLLEKKIEALGKLMASSKLEQK